MIHSAEWFRVHPEGPWLKWVFKRRLLMAFTPTEDWRVQVGLHWDKYGMQFLVSIGPLHLGLYIWRGET